MNVKSDPAVAQVFDSYPDRIQPLMRRLRNLVIEAAEETGEIDVLEEVLRWGEPSYIAKKGSTLRMDWKSKHPDQYALYFKCTSKLIPMIKEVYGDLFSYEKTRAIVINLNDTLPEEALKDCISMALTYHAVKHLPRLGR